MFYKILLIYINLIKDTKLFFFVIDETTYYV